jgi:hypothetical protein
MFQDEGGMASLTVIYWRDIPAQVVAETGRGRNRTQAKIELHRRFALAIDEAAMRDGADSSDDYLADWRRAPSEDCSDDLQAEAEAKAKAIEAEVDSSALAALVAAGGHHLSQD